MSRKDAEQKTMGTCKLTPEVTQKIVKALKVGNFVDTAVVYAGISTATYYKWRNRGEDELTRYKLELKTNPKAKIGRNEKKYVEFRDTIDHALSFAENMALVTIHSSFPDDWKAAAWYLERRYPDRWGRKVIGFGSDDGSKDFANAFANAIKEVEADERDMSAKIVPIK